MAPNPNSSSSSYTTLAKDCLHVIQEPVPSPADSKLSRPAYKDGTSLDSEEDEYPISTNTLLCPWCEQDIRELRQEAELAYEFLYDSGKGERNADLHEAAGYHRISTMRVVNFDDRMADRTNTVAQVEAVAAREEKWEAGKRVSFAVEEGMGPGEKGKKKMEKKAAIILGPPSDSTYSFPSPVRAKEDS